jgi:hypothetical protein
MFAPKVWPPMHTLPWTSHLISNVMWRSIPNFVQIGQEIRKVRVEIHLRPLMQRNPCCLAKTLSIKYSECVSVALVIKHAQLMRHIVPCGLSGTTKFFCHYLTNCTNFGGKKVSERIKCVLIFFIAFVWNISHSEKHWARYDQKCVLLFMQSTRFSSPVLMKLELSLQI